MSKGYIWVVERKVCKRANWKWWRTYTLFKDARTVADYNNNDDDEGFSYRVTKYVRKD